jgi:hypothetical protein
VDFDTDMNFYKPPSEASNKDEYAICAFGQHRIHSMGAIAVADLAIFARANSP